MHGIFYKYRQVIVSGLIVMSLIVANFFSAGSLRDFFVGMGLGVALVSFGQSIGDVKSKKRAQFENKLSNE